MKRKDIVIIGIICAVCSIIMYRSTVSAYAKTGYKWNSSNIKYRVESYAATRAKNYFYTAANIWDSCNLDAKLTASGNAKISCCDVNKSNVSWDAITIPQYKDGKYASAMVQVNRAAKMTYKDDGALQSVLVHEFGHIFGLAHMDQSKTIMNGYTYGIKSRYGIYGIKTPQKDDKNGVNAIY